jgi:hypothetical protein
MVEGAEPEGIRHSLKKLLHDVKRYWQHSKNPSEGFGDFRKKNSLRVIWGLS